MGTYRITGALEATGGDVCFEIEAADEGMAEKIAAGRGVLVQSIEAMGASGKTLKEEAAEVERHAAEQRKRQDDLRRAQHAQPGSPVPGALWTTRNGEPTLIDQTEAVFGDIVEIHHGKPSLRTRQFSAIEWIVIIAFGYALGRLLFWFALFGIGAVALLEAMSWSR
jgi:hypothetical protein